MPDVGALQPRHPVFSLHTARILVSCAFPESRPEPLLFRTFARKPRAPHLSTPTFRRPASCAFSESRPEPLLSRTFARKPRAPHLSPRPSHRPASSVFPNPARSPFFSGLPLLPDLSGNCAPRSFPKIRSAWDPVNPSPKTAGLCLFRAFTSPDSRPEICIPAPCPAREKEPVGSDLRERKNFLTLQRISLSCT